MPAPPSTPAPRKRPAASAGIVDDFSDSEGESEGEDDAAANLDSDEIMIELRKFFGANADRVSRILKLWNAYADLFNALCEEWTSDLQSYRDERAYQVLKSGASLLDQLNTVSNRRHKSAYPQLLTGCTRGLGGAVLGQLSVKIGPVESITTIQTM